MESFICETPYFPEVSFNQDNNDVLHNNVDEVLSSLRFVYLFNSALYQTDIHIIYFDFHKTVLVLYM